MSLRTWTRLGPPYTAREANLARHRFRVLILVAALAIVAGVVSGCISVKSYVDPELPKVGYGDLLVRRDKRPIVMSLEFQRNGNVKPAISERVQEKAKTILATTNLFSAVSISSDGNVDRLELVLNNIADTGDAIGKGIKTGLTFGGVGSRVTDSYVLTATFKPTGGPAVQKIYRHALHSAIGNADLPPDATRMSVQQAFDRVLQDLLLKLMRDLQTEELLQ